MSNCGPVKLTGERWSGGVRELVLESVKQLGWPGLPAEMTVVTGERSRGAACSPSDSLNLCDVLKLLSRYKQNTKNMIVISHLGIFRPGSPFVDTGLWSRTQM